jgi:tetratricopeptide (TPR) repeat protein
VKALLLLQDTQHISLENKLIISWLSVIEAEAHADQKNAEACMKALDRAKEITSHHTWGEDKYATGFNRSRLASYEGSCYLRLRQPDNALSALQRALNLLDSSAIRRRSRLLTYMSEAYAQLGDIQSVERYASQALTLTVQTRSLSVLQRVQSLRERLEPWEGTSSVKALEKQLVDTRAIITNAKEIP